VNSANNPNNMNNDNGSDSSLGYLLVKSNFIVKDKEESLVNPLEIATEVKKTKEQKSGLIKNRSPKIGNGNEQIKTPLISKSFKIQNSCYSNQDKYIVQSSNDALLNIFKNQINNKSSTNEQNKSNSSNQPSLSYFKRHGVPHTYKYFNSYSNRIPLKVASLKLFEVASCNQSSSRISFKPASSNINNKYTNSVVIENCHSQSLSNPSRSANNMPSFFKEVSVVDLNLQNFAQTQSKSSSCFRNKFKNIDLNKKYFF
jgi:hypothetical protein